MPASREYCAERSERGGEPMAGTADTVTAWVMLEHRPAWSARPLEDDSVDDATRNALGAVVRGLQAAGFVPRVQLIRQPSRTDEERVLFLQLARDGACELFGFVASGGDAPRVDVDRLLESPAAFAGNRLTTPHYFVCTNGQRDLCCARFGLPVYAALAERVGARAWQTTHVGGHRFAPNVLVLPAGALFGRVTPERVDDFVGMCERGALVGELLRGRSWREPVVQAAEAYLLRECGGVSDGPVEITENGDTVHVRFVATGAEVALRTIARERIASCGDTKAKPTREFELVRCLTGRHKGV